jgi:two-component system, cell cycle sensor histidine kinase and response regulator CckA
VSLFHGGFEVRRSHVISLWLVGLALLIFAVSCEGYDSKGNEALGSSAISGKTLKTIIVPDYYPYTFVNDKGMPDGFSVDLAKAVVQSMDMTLDISADSWEHAKAALENGTIDFLPMTAASHVRRQSLDFSAPHTIAYDAIFVRRESQRIGSLNDLSGKTIIVMNKDAAHDVILATPASDSIKLILVDSLPYGLRLLASGEGDAAIMPKLVGLLLVKQLGITNIDESPITIESYARPFSFAVKKGNTVLLERLSQGLSIVKADGRYHDIYEKWFGVLAPPGLPWKSVLKYIVGIVGVSALVGIALLLWSFSLKRLVKQRTETLESEISTRKKTEEALHRLYRELQAVTSCNQILLRAEDEQTLLNEICRIICDDAGYRLAWVGYAENDDAKTIRPVAWAGFDSGYIADTKLSWADDTERGRGPAGTAIRSGETVYVQDFTTDPRMAPWRESALQRGYRSGIALPLKDECANVFGVLLIYATESNAITPDEIRLMEELAGDLAFGISGLRARIERKRAEDRVRESEELHRLTISNISDTMLITNDVGDFTYVCPNTHVIFGHSQEEVEAMGNVTKLLGHELFDPSQLASVQEIQNLERGITDTAGNKHFLLINVKRVSIKGGTVLYTCRDITERKRAEEATLASEEKYRTLFEESFDGLFITSPGGKILDMNKKGVAMFGYDTKEEILSLDLERNVYAHPPDRKRILAMVNAQGSAEYDVVVKKKNGQNMITHCSLTAVRDETGVITSYRGIIRDITERRLAEETLRTREAQLSNAVTIAHLGPWEYDVTKDLFTFNDHFYKLFRATAEQVGGYTMSSAEYARRFVHPDDMSVVGNEIRKCIEATDPNFSQQLEHRIVYADGEIGHIYVRIFLVKDEFGRTVRTYGVNQDITDRKQMEQALTVREQEYRTLVENIPDLIVRYDTDLRRIYVNPAWEKASGLSARDVINVHIADVPKDPNPINVEYAEKLRQVLETGTPQAIEFTWVNARGVRLFLDYVIVPEYDQHGKIVRALAVGHDLTERRQAEEALKESEEQYRTLFEESMDGVYSVLRDGTITDANASYCELFGYTREEIIGKNILELYLDPTDRSKFQKEIEKQGFVKDYEVKGRKRDGTGVECLITSSVHFGKDGSIMGYRGILRDRTAYKALQKQLLQAQKMEAIGTLSGGIAHDFNNLLTVVMGFSELLLAEKDQKHPEYGDLQKIFHAAKTGGELVQRLLTFSRKSEPKPVPMNLNKQIVQVEKLLRRTIPKMVDIRLDLSPDLPAINADQSQVEQVLMNLAVNARDAMPDVGKLTVRTSVVTLDREYCRLHLEATPGEHVLLEVSDTGHGMDKETVERIFEPFFTTKEIGKGTGLGLATVYGIVKQHNGHITVYSEVGTGTTFRVYLPAIKPVVEPEIRDNGIMPASGTETVLLVDDEEFVRELGARILTKHGYTVLQAENGRQALKVFKSKRSEISLVILDLIMPEMGGTECLKELLKIDPQVTVLVASGFSADASMKETTGLGAKGFVSKPFRAKEFLRDVRRILDR